MPQGPSRVVDGLDEGHDSRGLAATKNTSRIAAPSYAGELQEHTAPRQAAPRQEKVRQFFVRAEQTARFKKLWRQSFLSCRFSGLEEQVWVSPFLTLL